MKKLWTWIASVAWPWLRKNWRTVGKALLVVLAAIGLAETVKAIVGILPFGGIVNRIPFADQSLWAPLPGETSKIAVKTPDGWKSVDLPKGVSADSVTAAALVGGKVQVERHAPTLDNV